MSDEIKKILRDLDFASGVFDYTLTPDKCTFLKDYITNLRQELDITNEKWEKDKQFCNCRLEENVELRKENDYLTNELNTCMIERNKYVSRVEKAIEYSKGNIQTLENRLSTPFCNFEKATKELSIHQNYLELLQGESNE